MCFNTCIGCLGRGGVVNFHCGFVCVCGEGGGIVSGTTHPNSFNQFNTAIAQIRLSFQNYKL